MSRRRPRLVAAALLALALLALGAGSDLGSAAAAPWGATSTGPGPAVGASAAVAAVQPGRSVLRELGTCIGTSGRLLVLLLIDESGSLQQTDPRNQRVTAAKAALASLEDLGWLVPSRRPRSSWPASPPTSSRSGAGPGSAPAASPGSRRRSTGSPPGTGD